MTSDNKDDGAPAERRPTRQESLRPLELIGGAAILAVFVGLVVIFSTRQPLLALIFFGVAFIVTLVVLAMFTLGREPAPAEIEDLEEQDAAADGGTAPATKRAEQGAAEPEKPESGDARDQ